MPNPNVDPPAARWNNISEWVLVLGVGVLLTVVLTYPVAFQIDRVGRINTDDGKWSIWVVSWVAHALTTDPRGLYNANIFYPHRNTLAFSEPNLGAGVLAAPVWIVTENPHTTHNVVFLIAFVLAFVGAHALAKYLGACRQAALITGVLFAFCPFMFARTAHVQLLFIGTLPICLLAFHRLIDRPTVARSVWLGLALWFTALSCGYYGIFAALMIGLGLLVYGISRGVWRSADHWIGIGLAAFTSIGLTLPFFLPYVELQDRGLGRTLDGAREYSANLGAWGASAAHAHRWWLPAIEGFNEVLFPGILATTLGLAGLWYLARRSRDTALFYGAIALFAFWGSFGPRAGLYTIFYWTIPVFDLLRAPARLGVLTTLVLVMGAGLVLSALLTRARRPNLMFALLACLALGDVAEMPLTQFREVSAPSQVYQVLATLPRGAVVELPFWYQRSDFPRHAGYMLNSTVHWQPLINGYSDYIPQDFRKNVMALSSFPTRESFGLLGKAGARYVVFHLSLYDVRSRARLEQRLAEYAPYLRPIAQDGSVRLYEIVGWPN